MAISAELSRRLQVFGFFNALLIVLIHSMPSPEFGSMKWWLTELLGRYGLCRIAVPYFFVAAGFFVAGHVYEDGWYKREVHKRVSTLVVPYLLWVCIGLVINYMFWVGIQTTGKIYGFQNPFYKPLHVWFINSFGINPFVNEVGPLWFVRDLFGLIVISPFLFLMIRWLKWWSVCMIFLVYGYFAILQLEMNERWYNFFEYFISLRGLCYFTLGLKLRQSNLMVGLNKYGRLFVLVGGGLLVTKITLLRYSLLTVSAVIDVIMVPILMVGMFHSLRVVKFPSFVSGSAFALYLMHTKFLLLSIAIITILGGREIMSSSVALWFVRCGFATVASVVVAVFIKKYMPFVSRLIFGGR